MALQRVILFALVLARAASVAPQQQAKFLTTAKQHKVHATKAAQKANPDVSSVISQAETLMKQLNTTADSVKTLITTANTSGCDFTDAAAAALDKLTPALDAIKSAAGAIAALPWTGQTADTVKAQVQTFVDDMVAKVEAARVALGDGCSTLSSQLTPLMDKFLATEDQVYGNFADALTKLDALASSAQAMMLLQSGEQAKLWPFSSWFGGGSSKDPESEARSAILKANSSVELLMTQLDALNQTVIDDLVNDIVTVITDSLTQFQSACLSTVSSLPSQFTTQAAVYCTKSTDYVDTVTSAISKIADQIPAAVDKAKAELVKVYPIADNVLAAIDKVSNVTTTA